MISVIGNLIRLLRPVNALLAGGATAVGGLSVGAGFDSVRLGLGVAAVIAGVGAGNALNDASDAAIDRRAHPERPVAAGELSPTTARRTAQWLFFLSTGLAFGAGVAPGLLALEFIVLLIAYEIVLKRHGVWGHLAVSLVTGSVFVFGAFCASAGRGWPQVSEVRVALAMASVAVLANLGREFLKSLEDAEHDQGRRTTVAHRWGSEGARWAATSVFVLAVALGVAWTAAGVFGGRAAWALVPAYVVFLAAAMSAEARSAVKIAKVGMALALLGFVAIVLI